MTPRFVTLPVELVENAASIIEEQLKAASDVPDALRKHIREQVPRPVAFDLRDLRAAMESGTMRDLIERLEGEPDLREVLDGASDHRIHDLLDRIEGHGNEDGR